MEAVVFLFLFLTVGSGLILSFRDQRVSEFEPKPLLKVVLLVNQVGSTILLAPIQFLLSIFVIFFGLLIFMYVAVSVAPVGSAGIFVALTCWFLSIQFYPKVIWKMIQGWTNSIAQYLRMPEVISSWIEFLFRGKVMVYAIAVAFVLLDQSRVIFGIDKDEMFPGLIRQIVEVSEASILTFVALDIIVELVKREVESRKETRNTET